MDGKMSYSPTLGRKSRIMKARILRLILPSARAVKWVIISTTMGPRE